MTPPDGFGWCVGCDGAERWENLARVGSGGAKCPDCRGVPPARY